MTTGRRSSPVPQIRCVGGTAGCHSFQPKVVQCMNRGSDGYDVQWECKAEMDSAYQFGKIQVSCEGYDYPDDPFILRGSCGVSLHVHYMHVHVHVHYMHVHVHVLFEEGLWCVYM